MTAPLVLCGDCLTLLPALDAASVDAVVTDPPYGLRFMGKDWDHGVPGVPFWTEILRVAKPGAYLVAFGGSRTYHRLACAVEDAGWELQDCLSWLYGSGFPLVRLITPPNGTVLDPFAGSGSTGCAAVLEGRSFVGIERSPSYCEIANARIAHHGSQQSLFSEVSA